MLFKKRIKLFGRLPTITRSVGSS